MKKVLVTGAAGQLGYDVARALEKRNIEANGVDIADFDLTDELAVTSYIGNVRPDVIVHCAAYTAVDKAEDNADAAYAVNVLGTRYIAQAARGVDAKLMYISTDYVFDGEKEGVYDAEDPKNPLGEYGRTKYQGEVECQNNVEKLFIVRLSWVFGKNGGNFVKTMLRLSETKKEIGVVSDQTGSPTYTPDAAELICSMILTEKYGVYQVSNEGYCSWYEFAKEIMSLAGKETIVTPLATADYPTRAKRPPNSCFSRKELDANGFARLPHWKDALARYLKEIEQ